MRAFNKMSDTVDPSGFVNKSYNENENEQIDLKEGKPVKVPEVYFHLPDDEDTLDKGKYNGALDYFEPSQSSRSSSESSGNEDKEKSKEEKKGKKKRKFDKSVSFLQLFRYADRLDVFLMVLGTIFGAINGLAFPFQLTIFGKLATKFIDFDIQEKQNATGKNVTELVNIEDEMKTFALIYMGIGIASWIAGFVQCAFWSVSAIRQVHRIRLKFLESIMRQNIGWFDEQESGGLTSRMFEDTTLIQTGIGDKIGGTVQALTTFLSGFILSFYFGWKLALVVLSLTPLLMFTGMLSGRVMASFTSKEQRAYAAAGAVAEEAISSIRTVVAFGGEKDEVRRYNEKLVVAEKAGVKKSVSGGLTTGAFQIVIGGVEALAFWYGSVLVADGDINGGDLLTIFFCLLIGAIQIGQAGPNLEALATARGAAYYIFDVITRASPIDPLSNEGSTPDIAAAEDIQFKDINFSYPSRIDIKILNNFNLTIKKGSTVALVGESGCGKSTVVKLLQRFYDTNEGAILIGGTDVKDINVSWLRQNIGIVSQEPILFDTTIAENIRLGRNDATQAEIEMAAMDANAHEFIKELPKGYDTKVGEGGAQLSGGQKQRIAIARALVRNPQILLLDEATSALDTESESIVQTALDNASIGRTTIIIAHRLSTVKNADCIVTIKDGQVVEAGTHEKLMSAKGAYYELVILQTIAETEISNLSEVGSILSEEEREELLEARMVRTISQLSTDGQANPSTARIHLGDELLVKGLQRAISVRKSKGKMKKMKKLSKKRIHEEETVAPAPISRIIKYNKEEWHYIAFGLIFSVVNGLIPIVFAVIISQILRAFTLPKEEMKDEARLWSLVFLGMGFANAISHFLGSSLFGIAGEALTRRLRAKTFETILNQEIGYFDDPYHGTGQLTSRLATDATKVKGATSSRISILLQVASTALAAMVMAFYYSWKLTLLMMAFFPLLLFAGVARASRFKSFAAKEGKRFLQASSVSNEAIMNIRTVASLGKENFFIRRFGYLVTLPYGASKKQAYIYGITFGSARALSLFANAAAFRLGGHLVQNGDIKMHNVFKIVIAATFGSIIAGQVLSFTPDYLSAKVAAGRIFKLFDRKSHINVNDQNGEKKEQLNGNISFQDVLFNYPARPDVPVLQGLNLNIEVGQKIALVGASGCGKSTSVGLLERFYDPSGGSIHVDGINIRDLNLSWLRSQISIVSQEPILFARSIRENIMYGMNGNVASTSQKEIEEAAKAANIHSFIMSLPQGYNTMAGEKGSLISGGQKQRIAIARALIRNPKILLLDEATSALDSESEKVVQDALDTAMENRTSIIIAHRLSTVQNADKIFVIQGGSVVEMGTHSELLAQKGAYWVLNNAQS